MLLLSIIHIIYKYMKKDENKIKQEIKLYYNEHNKFPLIITLYRIMKKKGLIDYKYANFCLTIRVLSLSKFFNENQKVKTNNNINNIIREANEYIAKNKTKPTQKAIYKTLINKKLANYTIMNFYALVTNNNLKDLFIVYKPMRNLKFNYTSVEALKVMANIAKIKNNKKNYKLSYVCTTDEAWEHVFKEYKFFSQFQTTKQKYLEWQILNKKLKKLITK